MRGDEIANRASATVPAVGPGSTRWQPGMTLTEEMTRSSIEDFLMSEEAQRFHGWVPWRTRD